MCLLVLAIEDVSKAILLSEPQLRDSIAEGFTMIERTPRNHMAGIGRSATVPVVLSTRNGWHPETPPTFQDFESAAETSTGWRQEARLSSQASQESLLQYRGVVSPREGTNVPNCR